MALKPNFSVYLSNKAKLATLAKRFGYVQIRQGVKQANVRALIEAIIAGEITLSARKTQGKHKVANSLRRPVVDGIVQPTKPGYTFMSIQPVQLEGKPLSQQIIEDRR